MKRLKITGLFVFLLSSINLFGSTEVSSDACLVTVFGVNNCGNLVVLRAAAWTTGDNTSHEKLCDYARWAADVKLNSYTCAEESAPQLPYLT
jgi:hypothetical protein